jgi:hypothetical protein
MAAATSIFFTGQGGGFRGDVASLFAVYGTGFVLMSATLAALFADACRNPDLGRAERARAKGEIGIWLILAATGAVSILLSRTRFGPFAAFAYSTLPLSIGLFLRRFDWTGGEAEQA